jgi:NADPH:quinone reductase-like Zn-dependent oxidoreductase
MQAAGVAFGDLLWQSGTVPTGPQRPYTPGYDVVGTVEALGTGVTTLESGQYVAALLSVVNFGGYAELVVLPAERAVPVPADLDTAQVACLTLNYVTALQIYQRVAQLKAGQRVLIHGAGGGVGSALMDVGRELGLVMYGTASKNKHPLLERFGATPIDYKSEDFVARVKALTTDGVDLVIDPFGDDHFARSFRCLRPGGLLLATSSYLAATGKIGMLDSMLGMIQLPLWNLLPNGKKAQLWDITQQNKADPAAYRADLTTLMGWLEADKLHPEIGARFRLEQAAEAQRLLLDARVAGKIILEADWAQT